MSVARAKRWWRVPRQCRGIGDSRRSRATGRVGSVHTVMANLKVFYTDCATTGPTMSRDAVDGVLDIDTIGSFGDRGPAGWG